MKKALLGSLIVFFYSVNTLAAILYAGAPALDDGGGFITLSPFIDCVFWGFWIFVSGLVLLVSFVRLFRRRELALPSLRPALRYPTAYLATLADLSLIVLLLGAAGFLYRFSDWHIPFWGYVGLLTVLYVAYGVFFGWLYPAPVWSGLLYGTLIAALFGFMAHSMLAEQAATEAYWRAQAVGIFIPSYTEGLMDSTLGVILGRLNLPSCVIMDAYAYAYFENLGGCHNFPREVITMWVSVAPPVVFTLSWLVGTALSHWHEMRKANG